VSINAKKSIWHILLWGNWTVILFYWLQGSGALLTKDIYSIAVALGRFAGLAAAMAVLTQFFFMGRMPFLERVFGLDKLSRIHHRNGNIAFFLILFHPLLLVVGYSSFTGFSWQAQFWAMISSTWQMAFAGVAFALFLFVVIASLTIVMKRLRYELWYFIHLAVYLAIFGSFWHQLFGTDLVANKIFYGYWIALYAVVLGSHLVFRFVMPLVRFARHKFRVSRVVREGPRAVSIYISGEALQKFPIVPGQFMILRFLTKSRWWQAHPFSLSRPFDGKKLRITVRELGDFTGGLKDIPVGTRVMIDGPYGVFTDFFSTSSRILMIAGGIGITPIRSLMEEMLQKGKQVTLLYANRTVEDAVFTDELNALASHYHANIVHIISDDPLYAGEKGRVDAEKIARLVPDAASREIYLCGPPPMMDAIIHTLAGIGVPRNRIHFEKFSL